jgi:protein-tyrosine phosphatase
MNDSSIKVERKATTYRLTMDDTANRGDITIFPSLSADRLEGEYPGYRAAGQGLEITVDDATKRHFFHIVSAQSGTEVVAERCLAFDGTPNFRDYGGYANQLGKRVRWGCLYRSGQLSALSGDDLRYFENLNIDTVFDFRRIEEAEKDVSLFPTKKPNVVGLPIDPGSILDFFAGLGEKGVSAAEMENFMRSINSEFAIEHAPVYKKMFDTLLSNGARGTLIHCSAGKDRTGFAAAIILSSLGVARDVVMHDYLLTGEYFDIDREIDRIAKKYNWSGANDTIRPMLAVRKSYLLSAFDAIDKNFSSMDMYLEEMLGIGKNEREYLAECYLV